MEFTGRIMKVLEQRKGTSQRTGNEWTTQPFIFEYFENETDRYSDKVVLETFDTNIIPKIVENAQVRIGFGHGIDEYNGNFYNRIKMYKIEFLDNQQPTPQKPQTGAPQPQNAPNGTTTQPAQPNAEKTDDLPF